MSRYSLTYSTEALKGEHEFCQLSVLYRGNLNFCVRSTPLRGEAAPGVRFTLQAEAERLPCLFSYPPEAERLPCLFSYPPEAERLPCLFAHPLLGIHDCKLMLQYTPTRAATARLSKIKTALTFCVTHDNGWFLLLQITR